MQFFDERFTYLDEVEHPETIVFTDFDETYFVHQPSQQEVHQLRELEDFLVQHAYSRRILFGWVTGSSLESLMGKIDSHRLRLVPHFIASSLGSMVTIHNRRRPYWLDDDWHRTLSDTGFCKAKIFSIADELIAAGLPLSQQQSNNECHLKQSFYLRSTGQRDDEKSIIAIRRAASAVGVSVNINRCNPRTRDPEDYYDVDFTPRGSSKRDFIRYLCARKGISLQNAYAFGDSGNDIDMLLTVGMGWLVNNATDEARSKFQRVSEHRYAAAILHELRRHVDITSAV